MKIPTAKMERLPTERRNPRTMNIDKLSTLEVIELIHEEDEMALRAIDSQTGNIAAAADMVIGAFRRGGRLIYAGAGTSGRLGVLDASECPPTFGVPREQVQGIIAGGWDALRMSIEHAEDFPEEGAKAVRERNVCGRDAVCGIAASSTTPFVHGALTEARRLGAGTVFVTCNPDLEGPPPADVVIALATGPEVVAGSTRMKAGTATKMVLNMITTTAMIRTGKVFQNLMIDLTATCNKLDDRANRIVRVLTGLNAEAARELIGAAGGRVKTALVMHHRKLSREEAEAAIAANDGRIEDLIPRESAGAASSLT